MTSHKLNPADCLPPELFDKVMFLVGSHDIESLLICRLVCKEWKKKIMDSLWENPSKKWGTIIGRRFEDSWEFALPTEAKLDKATELVTEGILPSAVMEKLAKKLRESLNTSYQGHDMQVQEVKCAASLAHKGLLGSVTVWRLWLRDDLTSVPAEHLVSLVSSVTRCVFIKNVSGCDLVTILDSVKSQELDIYYCSLGNEETEALVRAMETRVRVVWLLDTTLDIEALTKYSGRGRCRRVLCYEATAATYRELRSWASNKGWKVARDNRKDFMIKRN